MCELLQFDQINPVKWNKLVLNSKNGSVFNTVEWLKVWDASFENANPIFLVKGNDDFIAGMPIIEIRKFGFKNYYSMPYAEYGGILVRSDKLAWEKLEVRSDKLAWEKLELIRGFNKLAKGRWGMMSVSDFYDALGSCKLETFGFKRLKCTTHLLSLGSGAEAIRANLSSSKKRALKKSETSNVKICKVKSEEEVKECYKMFEQTAERHNKKAPKLPVEFYLEVFRIMGDFLRWTIAEKGDTPLANIINFAYKDTIIYWDGGSYSYGLQYRPNDALIWETIRWGCENGYKFYNLGSSPTPGLLKFKEKWTALEKSYWFYFKESRFFKKMKYIRDTIFP